MFSLIKQVFIVLLCFSESLAIKRMFLNDDPCMVRPTLIDLNPVELKYYPFMITLGKCTGSYNVLSPKICVPTETKNVTAFNMITNKNESKKMIKHMIVNANSIVQHVIQIKNGIIKHVTVNVEIIINAKTIIDGILAHVFLKIASI